MARIPLASRPLDFVYLCFFLASSPLSSKQSYPRFNPTDFQKFYPKAYVLTSMLQMRQWWIAISADPLFAAAARGDDHLHGELVWFGCFAWLELSFQLPVFILGVREVYGILRSRSIYVLILAYGASTATTVLPCIVHFLQEHLNMTSSRLMLLSSYVPFFLVPLLMAVDMGFRVYNIVAYIEGKGKTE
ncbi:transmembrane protein 6/97 [Lentinula edodes]|nr:transmembrane protein 6/97 [Lentinula edodes]